MLQLFDIKKTYRAGTNTIQALGGVSLAFRKAEFVSVLGPSGCGKTTLLNIIGGLDRYDTGDLVIGGVSTKQFKGADWDAYRNRSVGFVFQTYNLISHQSVLSNVEISMTLSGVSPLERKKRAKEALSAVGLSDQANKKPNQLSGGQMQRVAIARALVNNPDIILADEPTGALDTQTSLQIMGILKEVAKTRLVIMVTHNGEMANTFSTRIVRLIDGLVTHDSMPLAGEELERERKGTAADLSDTAPRSHSIPPAIAAADKTAGGRPKKTSMSFLTALNLSFKNLLTKKGRTIITAFAGSIGIIGVSLVLALSGGMQAQVDKMQDESMANYPLQINQSYFDYEALLKGEMRSAAKSYTEFPDKKEVYGYTSSSAYSGMNYITTNFLSWLEDMPEDIYNTVSYTYSMRMNLVMEREGTYDNMNLSSTWQEMPTNQDFVKQNYELLDPDVMKMPERMDETVLVVDKYNRISATLMGRLGLATSGSEGASFDTIMKLRFKVVMNEYFYKEQANGRYMFNPEGDMDAPENIEMKIVGIVRIKEGSNSDILSWGFLYHHSLREYFTEQNRTSTVLAAQKANLLRDIITWDLFSSESYSLAGFTNYLYACQYLGGSISEIFAELLSNPFYAQIINALEIVVPGDLNAGLPTGIYIYPKDFATKEKIKGYIEEYNALQTDDAYKIRCTDLMDVISGTIKTMINTISIALTGFAGISLVVSSIMIAIITYVSVIERTKEIGILRSVGARKIDISSVFLAETGIIGFVAGIIGVALAWILTFPINAVIAGILERQDTGVNIKNLAGLSPLVALLMVALSILLTLIAGLIPSRIAAKKDPVVALRTE